MIVIGTQNTKKHGGRPTVVESRRLSKAVTVKFFDKRSDFVGYSKKDYEILKVRSRKAKKRLTEYVRESALHTEFFQSPTEAETRDYRMLAGMANNLNQLTKMAHQDGIIYLYSPLDNLLGEITDAVRAYRQDTNKKRKP